jgi:hypothetical protein
MLTGIMFSVQQYWAAWLVHARSLLGLREEILRTTEARGLTLLRQWLSYEQREQFEAFGYFDVVGSSSGTRFRIRYGSALNVYELDDSGNARTGWCFLPVGNLVAGDVMLAQKIALETDETGAMEVARKFLTRADLLVPLA